MHNIVVFGASGQLGQCFKHLTEIQQITGIYFPHESEANILDKEALTKVFEQYKPAYCINCAAYTAVDKAEEDIELATKINVTGVENLSWICKENSSVLIHISTDFVFEGDKSTPRKETDVAKPISIYGRTKLDGEKAVESILKEYYIIRTGWLYSEFANNFVKTMLKLGTERDILKIIADQTGTPTYGIDLAQCILNIIKSNKRAFGTYHYSNEGVASWYDFTKAIFDLSQTATKVVPIRTDEYVTKATRPPYSVLDKTKVKDTFQIEIPYWRESLKICIDKLKTINLN